MNYKFILSLSKPLESGKGKGLIYEYTADVLDLTDKLLPFMNGKDLTDISDWHNAFCEAMHDRRIHDFVANAFSDSVKENYDYFYDYLNEEYVDHDDPSGREYVYGDFENTNKIEIEGVWDVPSYIDVDDLQPCDESWCVEELSNLEDHQLNDYFKLIIFK